MAHSSSRTPPLPFNAFRALAFARTFKVIGEREWEEDWTAYGTALEERALAALRAGKRNVDPLTQAKEKPMTEWIAVLRAADQAARWHANQRRKGEAKEPYINHLLEVAYLVAEATEGRDVNLVIAALLHDSIEDQGVTRATIAEMFGQDVAALVLEVTDDKNLPKEERKLLQEETAASKSPRAKVLKLADKTSNLRALAASPPADWSAERRAEYVAWAKRVVEGLGAVEAGLESRFHEAARGATRECD